MGIRKKAGSTLLVLALATLSCGFFTRTESSNGPDNWQTYTSDEGGFSILFPTTPTEESTFVPFEVRTVKAEKGGIYYRASFGDLPESFTQDSSPDTILDTLLNRTIDSLDGNLIYKKEISLQGYPGREFKLENSSSDAVLVQRAYLVNSTRMYTQNAATTPDNASNSNIEKFLDSFTLIK